VLLFPYASSQRAEALDSVAEVGWQRRGDFPPYASGQLAALPRRCYADLKRAVGMCGEECEGAQVGRVGDVDGDS